jgi:hypothetical protein
MLEPFLDGLEMIGGRDIDPLVAEIAEHAFGIEFADIGIFAKEVVALFEGIYIFAVAGSTVSWGCVVPGITEETYTFLARQDLRWASQGMEQ